MCNNYNFEFYPRENEGDSIRLNFESDCVTLKDLRKMCVAFAIALGYDVDEVYKVFFPPFQDRLN